MTPYAATTSSLRIGTLMRLAVWAGVAVVPWSLIGLAAWAIAAG